MRSSREDKVFEKCPSGRSRGTVPRGRRRRGARPRATARTSRGCSLRHETEGPGPASGSPMGHRRLLQTAAAVISRGILEEPFPKCAFPVHTALESRSAVAHEQTAWGWRAARRPPRAPSPAEAPPPPGWSPCLAGAQLPSSDARRHSSTTTSRAAGQSPEVTAAHVHRIYKRRQRGIVASAATVVALGSYFRPDIIYSDRYIPSRSGSNISMGYTLASSRDAEDGLV